MWSYADTFYALHNVWNVQHDIVRTPSVPQYLWVRNSDWHLGGKASSHSCSVGDTSHNVEDWLAKILASFKARRRVAGVAGCLLWRLWGPSSLLQSSSLQLCSLQLYVAEEWPERVCKPHRRSREVKPRTPQAHQAETQEERLCRRAHAGRVNALLPRWKWPQAQKRAKLGRSGCCKGARAEKETACCQRAGERLWIAGVQRNRRSQVLKSEDGIRVTHERR